MTTPLSGSYQGHHAAARRLADAIREAALATMDLDDEALEAVAGGATGIDEVYWASADFIADWRADASVSA